ncbi:MAG: hypothetical protein NWQ29_01400 [Alphaproteobacteria bacterium]|nr:hypothetical protein [Alphaproteobacteria bacterium]
MYNLLLASLSIALAVNTATPAFSSTDAKPQSSGIFSSVGYAIKDTFSYIGNLFSKPESILNNKKTNNDSAELILKDAKVSERLHLEFAGPRGGEAPKPTVDLNAVADKIAPLPKPEEPSKPDNSKNLPIRKKIANDTDLKNMKNGSTHIEGINKKIANEMPQANLSNTLSTEKDASAPSMGALEARFASGNPKQGN